MINRETAWNLLREFTQSDSLVKHALAVEAAMRHYARRFEQNEETWGITGLLHDFDYERWPDPPQHTREGAPILRARGVPEEIVEAILSHAEWNREKYPLDRPLRRALFAVDELCGLITATAYVRPNRLVELRPASVLKKMKQKSFAAGVNRQDIICGAELLNLSLEQHLQEVIVAMQEVAEALGLEPPPAEPS